MTTTPDRRRSPSSDRRRVARGGRRGSDRPGQYPTVLVADGYDDARAPMARYLARFGFHVLEASTATEAVELLNRHQPQVILSGLHGPQAKFLYSQLESPPSTARLGLIVLLSSIDDPVPREATGVLTKPFMLRSMLDELRREIRAGSAPGRRRPVKNVKK